MRLVPSCNYSACDCLCVFGFNNLLLVCSLVLMLSGQDVPSSKYWFQDHSVFLFWSWDWRSLLRLPRSWRLFGGSPCSLP